MADTSIHLNDAWHDAENPGTLHDALRLDYQRTKTTAEKRPSLRRHMETCAVCQAIADERTGVLPAPVSTRKRIKLVIDPAQMHELLKLPAGYEIVHMYAQPDPNTVSILVAGEGLPEVSFEVETPLADVTDVTTHTTS